MPRSSISTAVLLLLLATHLEGSDFRDDSGLRSVELSALGDRMFREAHFEDAEAAYSAALTLDPKNVRGQLGLGRMASLFSDPRAATSHYSAAYRIAPRNPDTILAFASVLENPESRQILLRNFLALSPDTGLDVAKEEDVRARLRLAERLGTRPLSVRSSPYQLYRIPLFSIRTAGSFLRARINGGRELKLILDTGAAGIVLNPSAASDMDLEFLARAAVSGFGSAAPTAAHIVRALSFEAGELKIANLLLNVSEKSLTREADGLIGLDVFQDFRIRLDPPARVLELT